jgi:NYN domain
MLNSQGQQKGVDSLIVTDLIDLARNRAISDAVLLSGDEDVRVGVHIAQSYGVRVHLLGISPSRGSQSQLLLQEADTTTEWGKDVVGTFLNAYTEVRAAAAETPTASGQEKVVSENDLPQKIRTALAECAEAIAQELSGPQIESISANALLPKDIDGRLLTTAANRIGRQLEAVEKRRLRDIFKNLSMTRKKPN